MAERRAKERFQNICKRLEPKKERTTMELPEDFQIIMNRLEEMTDANRQRAALLAEKFNKDVSEHKNSGPDACSDVETRQMSKTDKMEGPEASTSYRENKGPEETSEVNAGKWPHMSMSNIRERRRPDLAKPNLLMGEREGSTICQMSKTTENMHERFPEHHKNIKTEVRQWPRAAQKGWTSEHIKKVTEKYAKRSEKVLSEWFKVFTSYREKKGPEGTSKRNAEKSSHTSMSNIRERRRPDLSKLNLLMGEHEGSTICQMSKTTQNMHERFPGLPKEIKTEVPQWPRDHQQKEFTLETRKKLPAIYAEASKKNVRKWPELSTSYREKEGPKETSKLNAEKWPHISMTTSGKGDVLTYPKRTF